MKITFTFLFNLFSAYFTLAAQEFKYANFGNPSNGEVEMKLCTFDKHANAVILLHQAYSDYDDKRQLITYHQIRIKILNEKGFDAANIKIPFWRKEDFERITDIEGITINPGKEGESERTKIENKDIYNTKLSEQIGEVRFAFPSVKAGSILEYRYTSVMTNYGGLEEWTFQDVLPVMISSYTLNIIPNAEFAYRVSKRSDLLVVIQPDNSNGKIYFEMKNIPSLDYEPYIDARRDYLQKVIFQLSSIKNRDFGKTNFMSTWNEVIREMLSDNNFGNQLSKNIPGTSDLMRFVENLPAEEKMKAVYNYVRVNMNWNEIYSKYTTEGLKSVWQKRQGTSGEINLLLVNLLRETGLEVYPLLVSERFHGKVDVEYPFIDQFNSVFACVIINDKKYYLDATDKYTPAHLIPYDILNTTALVVNRKNGGLITITNDSLQYEEDIRTNIDITENGSFSGHVIVKSYDYARVKKLMQYKENKEDFLKKYFKGDGSLITINNFEILNEKHDSMAFEQNANFSNKNIDEGHYAYIPLDLFSGFNENPFISDERFSNINFGYKRTITINTSISYSKNYSLDAIPKPITLMDDEKNVIISRKLNYDIDDKLIGCTTIIQFKKSVYSNNEYPKLKEIYKKMFSILKEPIVLKKIN